MISASHKWGRNTAGYLTTDAAWPLAI